MLMIRPFLNGQLRTWTGLWLVHSPVQIFQLAFFEVIPRNPSSLLDFAVRDIHNYCMEHIMGLNPKKCKEMVVNFMGNPNTIMKPLYIGNQIVEIISSYKLLGVIINENLKWNCHVDYITPKTSKKLYVHRLLKRAGVHEQDMLKVFRSSVRPILEYAVQGWQDIPDCLSDKIQSFQKRALKIIYPNSSYSQALSLADETILCNRRELPARS